jgi:hypothetical protein
MMRMDKHDGTAAAACSFCLEEFAEVAQAHACERAHSAVSTEEDEEHDEEDV